MRRYLLLFVMSLACIIGMQAKITVVPPTESTSGAYELTFSNGDATATGEYANMADLPGYVKNATSLVFKTAEGYSLGDEETTQIMGNEGDLGFTATLFPNLEKLDMGEAVLGDNAYLGKMIYAKPTDNSEFKGLKKLKSFVFPKSTTAIPTGVFNENTTLEEIILLENASLKEIPGSAFQGCRNLSNVRIPDGITEIGENAFEHCAFEAISLPNTLDKIQTNAFGDCKNLKTITIPASVTYIGPSSFQSNSSLTDVYVIGNNVKIGDSAFDSNLTQNEFKYDGEQDGDLNTVTIEDWKSKTGDNKGQIPLRLHIPNNPTAWEHYMNPNLRFLNALADPTWVRQAMIDSGVNPNPTESEVNNMINNISNYYKEKWYNNASGHENVFDSTRSVIYQLRNTLNPPQIYSDSDLDPEKWVEMENWRYFTSASGKFTYGPNEINNIPEENRGYFGWWNFMFVAGDIEEKTWPDGRMVDSRWYSAVFPFNMSYNQVMTAYGANTDVREFTYVNEHTVNGAKKRTVTFATIPVIPNNDKNEAGFVKKGMPYMIHPGVKSVPVNVGEGEEQTTVYRTIAGVDVDAATAELDNDTKPVTKDLVDGDNNGITLKSEAYTFKGTYKLANIPENTFYLGYDPDPDHYYPLAFYVTRKELVNKWNPFTSIVQHADESGNANSAKTMDLGFLDDGFEIMGGGSIATAIEAAPVVSNVNNGKVYNLNGQAVRESRNHSLAKGVYIIDGKKVVIR